MDNLEKIKLDEHIERGRMKGREEILMKIVEGLLKINIGELPEEIF